MVWRISKKSSPKKVVISITMDSVRFFVIQQDVEQPLIIHSFSDPYQSIEQLSQLCHNWIDQSNAKGLDCYWLLARNLYKTINTKHPDVEDAEISSSIKWLVKDQLERPLDELLINYYKPYNINDKNLTAVIAERSLIESLIELCNDYHLNLITIAIDELSSKSAIKNHLQDNKIIGLIDQDQQGLIYNFYHDKKLSFTRHIKGRFFPKSNNNEFSLESESYKNQTDQFILETQRTLDYCVSQVFRHPVDLLVMDNSQNDNTRVIDEIEKVTELPVTQLKHPFNNDNLSLTIAEIGLIASQESMSDQAVNFYLEEYRPKPLEFGFKYAMIILVIFMLGFMASGFLLEKQASDLTKDKQRLAQQLKTIQDTIKSTNLKNRTLNQLNIDQTITNRKTILTNYQQLLLQVKKMNPEEPLLYSHILNALSKQKQQNLWLTQISLTSKNISLQGKTTQAEMIPNYFEKLTKNSLLRSQFQDFFIERDREDKRIINFSMSNGRYHRAE